MNRFLPVYLAAAVIAIAAPVATAQSAYDVCLQGYEGLIPYSGQTTAEMRASATAFLNTLTSAQKTTCNLAVDSNAWQQWTNLPGERSEGLKIVNMSEASMRAAHVMFQSSLSTAGYKKATGAMLAENYVSGGSTGSYWVTVYGNPATDTKWGYQLEGHHYTANVIVVDDQMTITPSFFGIEPVRFTLTHTTGTTEAVRPYSGIIDTSHTLVQSIGSSAVLSSTYQQFTSTVGGTYNTQSLPYIGVPGSAMTTAQKATFMGLITEYLGSMPDAYANAQLAEVQASLDTTYFAWKGGTTNADTQNWYFRIHGPDIFVEAFNDTGIGGSGSFNHFHSVMRDPNNDYGVVFPVPEPSAALAVLGSLAVVARRNRRQGRGRRTGSETVKGTSAP